MQVNFDLIVKKFHEGQSRKLALAVLLFRIDHFCGPRQSITDAEGIFPTWEYGNGEEDGFA